MKEIEKKIDNFSDLRSNACSYFERFRAGRNKKMANLHYPNKN